MDPSVLQIWLDSAARTGDSLQACVAAAESVAGDPWSVVAHAGPLARARLAIAPEDLGLTALLSPCKVDGNRTIARVPAGAPYPAWDGGGRRSKGAFDTPQELCRRVLRSALEAVDSPPTVGLDPACGPGAFLVAMAEAGVPRRLGSDLDPHALAVARIADPGAQLNQADAFEADPALPPVDLLVGNPPFISPEHQSKELRARLLRRYDWLGKRFDLAVPFAAAALERLRPGGGLGLVLPSSLLWEPYAVPLRRRWLNHHRITGLEGPLPFPRAAVTVALVALRKGAEPAPLPPNGLLPAELLALDNAPLNPRLHPGDPGIVAWVRERSVLLGSLCEVDTGVVSHGPDGGKARLLHDEPGPGRVPYVDAKDLGLGRVRWLSYEPQRMHRAKRPGLFTDPKLLVQRLRGQGPVRVWLDRDGLYAGHTLTVVRPTDPRIPLERLEELLASPLTDGLLRIERGDRLDLYPRDLACLPVPRAWLADGQTSSLAQAWELDDTTCTRLGAMARAAR